MAMDDKRKSRGVELIVQMILAIHSTKKFTKQRHWLDRILPLTLFSFLQVLLIHELPIPLLLFQNVVSALVLILLKLQQWFDEGHKEKQVIQGSEATL